MSRVYGIHSAAVAFSAGSRLCSLAYCTQVNIYDGDPGEDNDTYKQLTTERIQRVPASVLCLEECRETNSSELNPRYIPLLTDQLCRNAPQMIPSPRSRMLKKSQNFVCSDPFLN